MVNDDVDDWEDKLKKLWMESDSVKLPLHELFDIKCKKCGSSNVVTAHSDEVNSGGCSSCGYGAGGMFYMALKCESCGQAKVIQVRDDD